MIRAKVPFTSMLFAVVASKQKAAVPLLQFLVPQRCEHGLLCLDGGEVGNGEELGHPNPSPLPITST